MNLPKINPKHRNILIISPIITILAVSIFGIIVFGSFSNLWDFRVYYHGIQNIISGQLPWASGVEFYYPPLAFVPVIIAYAISRIGGGFFVFMLAMWALMLICAIVTTLCVYYIGLILYPKKIAFTAALLNATAISVAYYVLWRFDPFPTCLAMVAVLATLYGDKFKGYLASVLGLFTKLWPIVLFPFLWIYNARQTSIIEEGKKRAFAFVLAGGLIFGLMLWSGYNRVFGYANMLGFTDRVYCNTIPYTVNQYLQMVNIAVPFGSIAILFRILTVVVVLGALYLMYQQPKNIARMLKLILVVIVVFIMFSQYRSPQYIVWFTPFAALLVADDLWGILLFIGVQILGYIEYPLAYGVLYENDKYVSDWALVFFTVFFIMLGLLLWRASKMESADIQRDDEAITGY
jgi:hypothetical protein